MCCSGEQTRGALAAIAEDGESAREASVYRGSFPMPIVRMELVYV